MDFTINAKNFRRKTQGQAVAAKETGRGAGQLRSQFLLYFGKTGNAQRPPLIAAGTGFHGLFMALFADQRGQYPRPPRRLPIKRGAVKDLLQRFLHENGDHFPAIGCRTFFAFLGIRPEKKTQCFAFTAVKEGESGLADIAVDEVALAEGAAGQILDAVDTAHVRLSDTDKIAVIDAGKFAQGVFGSPDTDGKAGTAMAVKGSHCLYPFSGKTACHRCCPPLPLGPVQKTVTAGGSFMDTVTKQIRTKIFLNLDAHDAFRQ